MEMRTWQLLVALILIGTLGFPAFGQDTQQEEPATASLTDLKLKDDVYPLYEYLRYNVFHFTNRGSFEVQIEQTPDRFLIDTRLREESKRAFGGGGAEATAPPQQSTTRCEVQSEGFLPLQCQFSQVFTGNANRSTVRYSEGKAQIVVKSEFRNDEATVDLPAYASDRDILIWLARLLPLEKGYQQELPAVSVDYDDFTRPWIDRYRISVLKEEEMKTPLGKFKTWRVNIENVTDDDDLEVWYTQEPPHFPLRIYDPQSQLRLEIEERDFDEF